MSKPKQTKTEKVRDLLTRPEGTSIEAICKATGWQPHSARAVLSGLRKAGYTVERQAAEKQGAGSVYRITAEPVTAE